MKYELLKSSFLGTSIDRNKSYLIIGGGIAGLLTAFRFKKAGISFKLLEKESRCGGLLSTNYNHFGISEHAANGFIWCPELQAVSDEIGLPLLGSKATAKARYLVRNKTLRQLPLKPLEILTMLSKLFFPKRRSSETIGEFGQQYFGTSFNQQILEPAMAGIYGADIKKLSLPAAVPFLAEAVNESAFLPLGIFRVRKRNQLGKNDKSKKLKGTCSFEKGMGSFVAHLENYLKDDIEYGIDGLSLKESKENLILTVPAYVSKHFFENELQASLTKVSYTSMISVTLFYNKKSFKKWKEGFGCLIPRNEGLNLLGVLFNSSIFEHRVNDVEHISITCMLRDDSPNNSLMNQLDLDIKNLIVNELDALFDINENPLAYTIYRWGNGIPLYNTDLYKSWFKMDENLKQHYPNRNLFGNYTGKISIRGMAQHIFQATKF